LFLKVIVSLPVLPEGIFFEGLWRSQTSDVYAAGKSRINCSFNQTNKMPLDDAMVKQDLFPFTLTRSLLDIRIGILTIREKGELFNRPVHDLIKKINHPWHIFQYNDWALREDFQLVTVGRHSRPISGSQAIA